ncbi:PQQ-binding-like beta-propeller repeat protein [Haloarchaeobius sp. HRN-SO-5]
MGGTEPTGGDELWRLETDGEIESSPVVTDWTVFVGSTDDNLYALDAE